VISPSSNSDENSTCRFNVGETAFAYGPKTLNWTLIPSTVENPEDNSLIPRQLDPPLLALIRKD